jgi:pantoate--beta-alanine ligase
MFVGCTSALYMICHTQVEIKNQLLSNKNKGSSTGFVPTMGALHAGHVSLVKKALVDNDTVVVSIFVNPTQFDNSADLSKYPRTLESDIALLKSSTDFSKVIVFAPDASEVYGDNQTAKSYSFGQLDHVMEGANRPGHFNGVGTILEFLFRLISPNKAYFGEKDFQQLQVVKSLVKQLQLPIQIIGCPIKRESNQLAMSSRNERLDVLHREKAGIIYQSLLQARKLYRNDSLKSSLDYINHLYNELNEFELEYFTIAGEENLSTLTQKNIAITARAFIVVHIQGVRLIDNLQF